jgi:TPR repeat protein
MYVQGREVPKDELEAENWMRKAADRGLAAGQFGLGSMYANGSGVVKDEAEAARWYRKAADQGDSAARNNLAFLLATATDPKVRNPKEAVDVAQKAVGAELENASYLDTRATAYFEAGTKTLLKNTRSLSVGSSAAVDLGNPRVLGDLGG